MYHGKCTKGGGGCNLGLWGVRGTTSFFKVYWLQYCKVISLQLIQINEKIKIKNKKIIKYIEMKVVEIH